MITVWYVLVALMLVAYVVLDGFDLGAGALYVFAARTDEEQSLIFRSIGPVWDGNEVWLIAAGGTLFYAFPLLYAASFSGFYLPLNMVLWLLILRAVGIEFRSHVQARIWREFFGAMFFLSSALLIVFFGAALGNVIRGVPLAADHYFFAPLWTDFRVGPSPGILDWYTILCALLAVAALCMHGALFVAMKTEGELHARMRRIARRLLPVVVILSIAALAASLQIRPELLDNYRNPAAWSIPVGVAAGLGGVLYYGSGRNEHAAFLSSAAYLVFMLTGAAVALYPALLPASTGAANSLTVYNAAAGPRSLVIGLYWWVPGMMLAVAYFILVYRLFAGKVRATDGHGHY